MLQNLLEHKGPEINANQKPYNHNAVLTCVFFRDAEGEAIVKPTEDWRKCQKFCAGKKEEGCVAWKWNRRGGTNNCYLFKWVNKCKRTGPGIISNVIVGGHYIYWEECAKMCKIKNKKEQESS